MSGYKYFHLGAALLKHRSLVSSAITTLVILCPKYQVQFWKKSLLLLKDKSFSKLFPFLLFFGRGFT